MLLDSSLFWSTRSVLQLVHPNPPCEFAVSTAAQSAQTEFAEFDDDYLHRIGNELDALANQRTTSEMDSTEQCDGITV